MKNLLFLTCVSMHFCTIKINGLSGPMHTLEADSSWTIHQVKQEISVQFDHPLHHIKLLLKERILPDHAILSDIPDFVGELTMVISRTFISIKYGQLTFADPKLARLFDLGPEVLSYEGFRFHDGDYEMDGFFKAAEEAYELFCMTEKGEGYDFSPFGGLTFYSHHRYFACGQNVFEKILKTKMIDVFSCEPEKSQSGGWGKFIKKDLLFCLAIRTMGASLACISAGSPDIVQWRDFLNGEKGFERDDNGDIPNLDTSIVDFMYELYGKCVSGGLNSKAHGLAA